MPLPGCREVSQRRMKLGLEREPPAHQDIIIGPVVGKSACEDQRRTRAPPLEQFDGEIEYCLGMRLIAVPGTRGQSPRRLGSAESICKVRRGEQRIASFPLREFAEWFG